MKNKAKLFTLLILVAVLICYVFNPEIFKKVYTITKGEIVELFGKEEDELKPQELKPMIRWEAEGEYHQSGMVLGLSKSLEKEILFFGYRIDYELGVPEASSEVFSFEEILEKNKEEVNICGILSFLEHCFREVGIDENKFAQFLFIISFATQIVDGDTSLPLTFTQMIGFNKTNRPSQVLLTAAICQGFGFNIRSVKDGKEKFFLAVPVEWYEYFRTSGWHIGTPQKRFMITGLSMDSPIGQLDIPPEGRFVCIDKDYMLDEKIFLTNRNLPSFPESDEDKIITVSGKWKDIPYSIRLRVKKNLYDFIRNLPQSFIILAAYAPYELRETGCIGGLKSILAKLPTEIDSVNFLLHFVQNPDISTYTPTDLRPVTISLYEGKSDCDTRSLILYGLLSNLGIKDVLYLEAREHVCLALLSKKARPEDGRYIEWKGKRYYVLDSTAEGIWGDTQNISYSCLNLRYFLKP